MKLTTAYEINCLIDTNQNEEWPGPFDSRQLHHQNPMDLPWGFCVETVRLSATETGCFSIS
jgi:hypothetical protein